jgi:hypothetical protein
VALECGDDGETISVSIPNYFIKEK